MLIQQNNGDLDSILLFDPLFVGFDLATDVL